MILKRIVKNALKRFGYVLVSTKAQKESIVISTPLDSINAARFLYYQNLFERTKDVPGDIVDCGVGVGRSLLFLSLLVKLMHDKRNIWGFDSFEGFPEPHEIDMSVPRQPKQGQYAIDILSVYKMINEYINDEQFVRSRITLVKGYFENTLESFPHQEISLLNLDVDLYNSYKVCLETLYPKLSVGGIITFDEYLRESHRFPGALKATNDFFEGKNVTFEKDLFYGKYYVVKMAEV